MIEPKRFLDAKGAPEEITYLLRVARRDVPPLGLRSSTWHALVAKSAVAGVVVGAAGAASTKGTAMAAGVASSSAVSVSAHGIVSKGMLMLALKSVSVCGGIGICAAATHQVLAERGHVETSLPTISSAALHAPSRANRAQKSFERPESDRSEERTEQLTLAPVPAEAVKLGAADASQVSSPARVQPGAAKATNPATANARAYQVAEDSGARARFEAQRVTDIRRMLRGGDGVGALQALGALDQQPTMHLLVQEREALRIDAHLLLGHESEVRRLAQRFRQRYPNSPLATRWSRW